MSLERRLEEKIEEEAEKLALRHHAYHNSVHLEHERNQKRISDAPPKVITKPDHWQKDRKFDPFYVHKHRHQIAKSIAKKIRNKEYQPNIPYKKLIPKSEGKHREITIFQIPDAAVSSLYYAQLLAKNKHRFSSFSYAYRNDRNVHFAIQDIAVDISQHARTFVSEFDFSDFFGSIDHEFLFGQFKKNGFFITSEEEEIIKSFLIHKEGRGIPQGTSISLFLANLVALEKL